MVGELITLPLRAGVRVTQMWFRVAGEATRLTIDLASQVLGREKQAERDSAPVVAGNGRPVTDATMTETPPTAVQSPAPPSQEGELPSLQAEPEHVSEQPTLVEELAEPGAEDGAGAEVHVQEPWDGYEQSNAREVIARLATASTAELAAVQLYESGHRGRQTILAAVERELRSANGSGSPTSERNR